MDNGPCGRPRTDPTGTTVFLPLRTRSEPGVVIQVGEIGNIDIYVLPLHGNGSFLGAIRVLDTVPAWRLRSCFLHFHFYAFVSSVTLRNPLLDPGFESSVGNSTAVHMEDETVGCRASLPRAGGGVARTRRIWGGFEEMSCTCLLPNCSEVCVSNCYETGPFAKARGGDR